MLLLNLPGDQCQSVILDQCSFREVIAFGDPEGSFFLCSEIEPNPIWIVRGNDYFGGSAFMYCIMYLINYESLQTWLQNPDTWHRSQVSHCTQVL